MLARAARDALSKQKTFNLAFRSCLNGKAKRRITHIVSRTATTAALPASVDDRELLVQFDDPQHAQASPSTTHTGLFGYPMLATPSAFIALADSTLRCAQLLTERIVRARDSRRELFKVVKNLDRLSNLLCGVIDLAELIRNAHPDQVWVRSAEEVYERLCEFMNVLNTHVGLYEVLQVVLSDREIVQSLSSEAYQTALIFWRDFEKSGIHLPPDQRERFVSLSTEILLLGRQFLNDTTSPRPPARISPSELQGLKDVGLGNRLKSQAEFTKRDLLIYPGSLQAQMIMRSAPNEEARRKIYIAGNSSTSEQIWTLERLLRARAEVARLVGKQSYAHMTLTDKMAKSPEHVWSFLDALLDHTQPFAQKALHTLRERKQAHLQVQTLPTIQAWDRDYYCPPEPPAPPVALPPLTLGTVVMALSRLSKHIYGISLRLVAATPGEVWHPDVRKLEVVDEDADVIGWIYADLFARDGKPGGAAHYTVSCSRRTDDDDDASDLLIAEDYDRQNCALSRAFETTHLCRVRGQDGIFQLPMVVLVCEFAQPTTRSGPTVLEWHEVLTLFHEMGHAMHSMIGRTEYQNVSGTRCATDFVELPSILMEHFLSSPAVLSLFHGDSTGDIYRTVNHHEDPCRSIDTHSQVLLALLDQIYHSDLPVACDFDSTKALHKLYRDRGLIPHVPGTSWQTQFGHLFGYGATYYSYLFDRAIASRVFYKLFARDPLNRHAGEKYKQEVLRHGGGRNPWIMVSTLLDTPSLQEGDADAMAEVGRWRIETDVAIHGVH